MTGRRDFVKTLGAAALGYAVQPGAPSPYPRAPFRTLNRIGLELYSVRNAMHKDPEGTLAAVPATGHTEAELLRTVGNFGRTSAQARASPDSGRSRAPSAHISPITPLVRTQRSPVL